MNGSERTSRRPPRGTAGLVCVLLLLPLAAIAGQLTTAPTSVELGWAGEEHRLLASWSTDRPRDVTARARWISRNGQVATVDTNGVCRPTGKGRTEVLAIYGGETNRIAITVLDGGPAPTPSFRQDVEPILTRLGCNQGSCHGKMAGQNGFRLSLRGYAPELDYRWLTEDVSGRRVNPAFPEDSLLVSKPLGRVPHEGLVKFAAGSRYHRTLSAWVAGRAPGPAPAEREADAARLEILPGDGTLDPGETQRLVVRAHWPDGRVRDVTWLAQFFSNDEATATVTADGVVKCVRAGETSVRAHFQGLVAVCQISSPYPNRVEPWKFTRRQNAVDDAVFAKLEALRIPPSARCDDLTFLRRAMLDTLGVPPTPPEVRAFLADRGADKRARLVDSLFERHEFADYWTLELADLLQNRRERDHDVRGRKSVRAFHAWLHQQVAANRPWDQLVRSILTAEGDTVSQPAVGYFVTLVGEKDAPESEITDSVAQGFLGTRIGCARCHNHPLERFTQDDFYHFAAFFSQIHLDRKDLGQGATTLDLVSREEWDRRRQRDEAAEKLRRSESAMLTAETTEPKAREEYENRRADYARLKRETAEIGAREPAAWQPRTHQRVEARTLDRAAMHWRPGENPRARLADWITSPTNDAFSAAMANRLWRHFLGVGLVEPVDDLRASNPPTNPALLRLLQRELVAGGFDLRAVMRLILNSRTYQLSSASFPGNEADHRFYSHFYARRLPAEVLADAVAAATGVPDAFDGFPIGLRAVQLPEPGVSSYFLSLFGRSERVTACACERLGEVTLPQLLHLQNSEETARKIRDPAGRLAGLTGAPRGRREVIEELYLACLGRPPGPTDLASVEQVLTDPKDDAALPDLFWALLNTKEFAFNH